MIPHVPIAQKTARAAAQSALAGLVVFGADHQKYLTGVSLPFLAARRALPTCLLWTPQAEVLILPAMLEPAFRQQGWQGELRTYPASAAGLQAVIAILAQEISQRRLDASTLGLDMDRIPAAGWAALKTAMPGCTFSACDGLLHGLRQVKTPAELDLLLDIAARTDHAMAGAMHHVSILGSKTEKFMSEDLRVHAMERGLTIEGYHALSLVASGPNAGLYWPLPLRLGLGQEKTFKPGEVVRHENLTTLEGYWGCSARTLTMGAPSAEQATAYAHLRALLQAALQAIQPGVKCSAVFAAVEKAARARGADWVASLGAGYGIGAAPCEGPHLTAWDDTPLVEDMVLVVDLVVRMPSGELLRARDTLSVTAAGCQPAECFQDWREPYLAALTF
jgi:Xaa-Pro dipeptidase